MAVVGLNWACPVHVYFQLDTVSSYKCNFSASGKTVTQMLQSVLVILTPEDNSKKDVSWACVSHYSQPNSFR